MKIGLNFFPVRPSFLMPTARRADELGYESLWLGEHLLFPAKITSHYPYDTGSGAPLTTTPLFDPLITLGYIAAQTKRIMLGTGIYIMPLRHPIIVAKLAATLDALSDGRFILGVGAGWCKEEFDAIEAPWEHRGARLEEAIHIMRRLWSEERISHEGRFYKFEETGFEPKPASTPLPVHLGGETPMAMKRAGRVGDGWFGMYHTPEAAAGHVRELRTIHGGERPFEISIGLKVEPSLDDIRRYRDAGVDRVVFLGRLLARGEKSLDAALGGLDRFADTVLHKLDA